MTTNALTLIKHLIERTKDDNLIWNKCSKANIELMPVNFFFRITVYFLSLLFIG